MNHIRSAHRRCPFADCPSHAPAAPKVGLVRHSTFKTKRGQRRRLLCKACARTFVRTRGTVYYRMRRPRAHFDAVAGLIVEGCPQAVVARATRVCASTVSRWTEKAASVARSFENEHLVLNEPVEMQLDELKSFGAGREQRNWVYNAIEVWSRVWLGARVGSRTLRNTLVFARELKSRCHPYAAPVLVTSDAFKYYEPSLRKAFGSACVYVQVENRYRHGRLVRTRPTLKLGSQWRYEFARSRSEDSRRPNTAYVERLNLFVRRSCAYLHRRTPSPMRKPQRLADVLDVLRVYYNFIRPHSALKFGKVTRTPAMQAGLTKRPLTLRDIFSWVPPPNPKPIAMTWSR